MSVVFTEGWLTMDNHTLHRVLFKILNSQITKCENLIITHSGFCMDVTDTLTGIKYDLFLFPKKMTKNKEIHLLPCDKPLMYSDFERSQQ